MALFRAASSRKPGLPASLLSSNEIGARLEDLERKLERLRALYESFFLGVERRPPHMPRQELNRLMLEAQQLSIRSAALRFRFQAVAQRWTLLTTYWNRTLREIESGTYRRDLQKAYRRIAARGEPLTEDEAATLGIPLSRAKAFVAQQNRRRNGGAPEEQKTAGMPLPPQGDANSATGADSTRTAPSAPTSTMGPVALAATASAAPPSDAGLDVAALHRAYAEAHARLGLAGAAPTVDQLRVKVVPHFLRLQAKHAGTTVDFSVVAEDGRVVIRAKRTG